MKVFKNFLYNVGYQVLIIIVPLILAPYISRVVGPDGVGTYSYTYSVVTLFGLFANLGMAKYGNREISKCGNDREKRTEVFSELISVKISCSVIVLALYLCFVQIYGGTHTAALFIQVFNLLSFMADISWFFWGMQEFRITTAICGFFNIASIFFIFTFVRTQADVGVYIFILAFRAFLIQTGSWMFLRRYVDLKPVWRGVFRKHLKSLVLLFLPVFAKYLYSMMDRIMLGNMVGITEVGYYENVQSITLTAVTVLTAAGDVVMPRMTVFYEQKEIKKAEDLLRGVFHLVSFLAVGMMFGFIAVADNFVPWFYGDKFSTCILLLQMIAPAVLFAGYSDLIRNVFLLPRYMDSEYVIALLAGAAVNFAVNFALIPRFGSAGAIVGTVCAELLVMTVQIWFIRRELKLPYFMKRALIYCLLGSLILIPAPLTGLLGLSPAANLALDICSGGAVYAAGVAVYICFAEREVFDTFRGLLPRKADRRRDDAATQRKDKE